MAGRALDIARATVDPDRNRRGVVVEGNHDGNVLVAVYSGGELERLVGARNTFFKQGREKLRDLLFYPNLTGAGASASELASSGWVPDAIAIGDGSAAVNDGQTGLQGAEVLRKAITRRVPTESGGEVAAIWQLAVADTEANGSGSQSLYEAVIIDNTTITAAAWARVVHSLITKTIDKSLVYSWLLKLTL